ncbi:MAG: hypothetical protein IJ079_00140 [Lachnospiraceae bacterium]|nr:hypothetical protein [Lachnospiraceae bacterium]
MKREKKHFHELSNRVIASVLALGLTIGAAISLAAPETVRAGETRTITVADSVMSKLTKENTGDNRIEGNVSDISGIDDLEFTGEPHVYIGYDYWWGYDNDEADGESWEDDNGNTINAIYITFFADITKESYDKFMAADIDSFTVQGMNIPKRDWEEGWKLFQIGGEDPKGEVGVGPNGEINPDSGEFTPDGTYCFYFGVSLPIEASTGYQITTGKDSSHTVGASEDLTITCSGALEDLASVSVDGSAIGEENYTLTSGSTILTLKAAYLNSLSAGKHTVAFAYKDGQSVSAEFTIAEAATETAAEASTSDAATTTEATTEATTVAATASAADKSPKTGDAVPVTAAAVLMLISIAGYAVTSGRKAR